jgi:hypothetical protein
MTTKGTILKVIREKCLDCCCGSSNEVDLCQVKCVLYPYRFGKDPDPSRTGNNLKIPTTEGDILTNQTELRERVESGHE